MQKRLILREEVGCRRRRVGRQPENGSLRQEEVGIEEIPMTPRRKNREVASHCASIRRPASVVSQTAIAVRGGPDNYLDQGVVMAKQNGYRIF